MRILLQLSHGRDNALYDNRPFSQGSDNEHTRNSDSSKNIIEIDKGSKNILSIKIVNR